MLLGELRNDTGRASNSSPQHCLLLYSDTIIQEFVQALADVVEASQIDTLRASPFSSLMADEITDVSVTKKLAAVVRCLLPNGNTQMQELLPSWKPSLCNMLQNWPMTSWWPLDLIVQLS